MHLCGSAQAYYLDDVAGTDRLVLRTSGLLHRSNKLMYDLITGSAINTFTGEALTGPLTEAGVKLEQISVVGQHLGWMEDGASRHTVPRPRRWSAPDIRRRSTARQGR